MAAGKAIATADGDMCGVSEHALTPREPGVSRAFGVL